MEALYNHSVSFDPQRCVGCTNCLRRCPTEAIRIREGQARIDASRCIDCGECIKVCTHKAKRAVCDHFEQLDAYKWKIALPSPSLYGQFNHLTDPDYLVEGLYRMGFDQVYEVGRGAELVTEYTRQYLKRTDVKKPVISSACPAVVRLIRLRYPGFCDHILPIRSPLEVAAAEALKEAKQLRPNLQREEIGVAFISPCPAKVSYLKNKGKDDPSEVDVVLSIQEVYFSLLHYMKSDVPPEHCSESGMIGLGWAVTGGEATALFNEKYLAADGIENVIQVLNHLEDDSLAELEYIELNACSGGCSGGVLALENPYISNARITNLRRTLPIARSAIQRGNDGFPLKMPPEYGIDCVTPIPPKPLGKTVSESIEKLAEIERIYKQLPEHDCGSCGSPNCRSFAEDVVKGEVSSNECIVMMRALLWHLAEKKFKGEEPLGEDTETGGKP